MLTTDQLSEFHDHGFVRIRGAFSRSDAAAMEERLWARLGKLHGLVRDDPATWKVPLKTGLQPMKTHRVFEPIGGTATLDAIDSVLGRGGWHEPKHWGQFLVSFPDRGATWAIPSRVWHTDFPYFLPPDRTCGVLLFSFVGEVPQRSGGTLVIEGSPNVVRGFLDRNPRYRTTKMKMAREALLRSDSWLKDLASTQPDEAGRTAHFMGTDRRIGEAKVRVSELTGAPGDIVIGHPWLLHAPAPNCGDQPRFMRVQRILASR